ncbi:MAG: flagellar motor protein MotB [Flavobacteriales bacterium CG_4_9_14_3_um_filter_40_17]|nr:MAG: flagellar motor protein MotB [Flavobacteriales bacterium CG_4_9_14_3_um_filter_40_17]
MKTKTNSKRESSLAQPLHNLSFRMFLLIAVLLMGIQMTVQAQEEAKFTKPSWWFGAAAGANFNFYRGSTQTLNRATVLPVVFHDGDGVGVYAAGLVEYYRPNTMLGFMLQAGYDSREGSFDQEVGPCGCVLDLYANLAYFTVEPSIRFAPFKSNLYVYGGPRFAFNLSNKFIFEQDQFPNSNVSVDFGDVDYDVVSMQIGIGYDIPLSSQNHHTQVVFSPFVSFHPYFGQDPRTVETWNVTTLRVGAALKFGRGRRVELPKEEVVVLIPEPAVQFTVNAPENIPADRKVRETFPLLNYVFFDEGSTAISDRYVKLQKNQVKDFREDQLEVFVPKNQSGRSAREMAVYYNVINILGDRMKKDPSSQVTLVGSSANNPEEAKEMANSVKTYLIDVFGIEDKRITVEGRSVPKLNSTKPDAVNELVFLLDEDRRVTIESNTPSLLMEFRSGNKAPLKPVEFVVVQEAPIDSYVTFDVAREDEDFKSWSLEIRDEQGALQSFGPFTRKSASIPGKSILGARPEGDYKVTMVGLTKDGQTVRKETTTHMVLWKPAADIEAKRFSVIFEFDEAEAIKIYEKYLAEVVAPKIKTGDKVIIHGHTDVIGEYAYNQKLSLDRANDVRAILEKSLAKAGTNDVTFEVTGLGENEDLSPFENNLPEERFYNRSVIIDIIPRK